MKDSDSRSSLKIGLVRQTSWELTHVPKADPDGYTLLMATSGHATNPSVYAKLPYDSAKAFVPIIHIHEHAERLRCVGH